jgi:hypothetical protein
MRISPEINIRINELVNHFTKGNVAAFARSIHVTQQRFDRLLKPVKKSGKFPMVKLDIVRAILFQYPNVHEVWLLSGAGPMLNTLEEPYSYFHAPHQQSVPYYLLDFIHEFELIKNKHADSIGCYIDFKIFNHADFWCHITGRTMEPEISSGDIVAMKEVVDIEDGILYGETYGIVTKNFCTIRRVVKGSTDAFLTLVPAEKNAEYAEQEIQRSTIKHLFQVLCCVKKL